MEGAVQSPYLARFGSFEVNLRSGELCQNGQRIKLPEQSFQILAMLLQRLGEVVLRQEIQKKLWPNDTVVEFENSINSAIKKLRLALGDSADHPKYIETLARRGYRWGVPVEWSELPRGGPQAHAVATVPALPDSASHLIGKRVSHYRVLEILGGGGMGVVYEAEDIKLGRRVALKFLPEELASDAKALERFEREARAASALNHPNICTIYEIEEQEGLPFIVMELLQGETLRELIATSAPLPLRKLLELAIQISEGLDAAHRKGIIHRDIKPANILVTTHGQVKILDFGLAKLAAELPGEVRTEDTEIEVQRTDPGAVAKGSTESLLSRAGVAMGTAGYMSPEQVRAEKLDARSDLYSFGLVLYEMASGQRAFMGDIIPGLHSAILNQTPILLQTVTPELPRKLSEIIDRALQKDPNLRYQTAAEMGAALNSVEAGQRDRGMRKNGSSSAKTRSPHLLPLWKVLIPAATLLIIAIIGWQHYSHVQAGKKLKDQDTIVLADFTNTTGDPLFDDTLKQALSIGLQQSPFLRVLSARKVERTLKMMGRNPAAPLDEKTAREVCQRTESAAVVTGMIANLGSQYVLGLNTVKCLTGESMAQELVHAERKEDVLKATDKALTKLRGELGESIRSIEKLDVPIWQATTESFEALKAFSLGQKAFFEKGDAEAIPFYQRAVELDPNFASAYAGLGLSYTNLHELSLANANYRKAYELRDRVTERERFGIDAFYYEGVTGELEKANQTYVQWAQSYPEDFEPHTNLSTNYQAMGQYDKALPEALRCLEINQEDASCYIDAISYYTALDRIPEAETMSRRATAHKIDFVYLHTAQYATAFLKGDMAEMQHQLEWGAGKSGAEDLLLTEQSDTEAFYGRFNRAREFSRRAIESDRRSDQKEAAALWQMNAALREAEVGNRILARRDAAEALKLAPSDDTRLLLALVLARTGELARPQAITSDVARRFPSNTVINRYWLPTINASLAINRKQPAKALEALRDAEPYELGAPSPQSGDGAFLYPAYVRGETYLALGDGKRAAAEYRKFLDHRGVTVNCVLGALAHLGLARAYAISGDSDPARAAYQDFLTLWQDADPDVPVLQQAKAEYAKLH